MRVTQRVWTITSKAKTEGKTRFVRDETSVLLGPPREVNVRDPAVANALTLCSVCDELAETRRLRWERSVQCTGEARQLGNIGAELLKLSVQGDSPIL